MLVLAVLRGLRMFLAYSIAEVAGNVAFTVLAVVAVLAGRRSSHAVMVTYCVGYGSVAVLFSLLLMRALHRLKDQNRPLPQRPVEDITVQTNEVAELYDDPAVKAPVKQCRDTVICRSECLASRMLRFSVWTALGALLWQAMQYYPMWYLQKAQGSEVTAIFAAVRLITQAVLIAATSVVTVVQTSVTKTWEAVGHQQADRQLKVGHKATAFMMLMACALLNIAAPWVIRVYPSGYAVGQDIIPLSLTFFMVGGHLTFLTIHFTLIEKTRYLFGLWLAGIAGSALFGVLLVHPEQSAGDALAAAAWAGVLGVSLALVACLFMLRIERRALDTGLLILILMTYGLSLPIYAQVGGMVAVVVLTIAGSAIFDAEDKRIILAKINSLRERARSFRGG